MLMWYTCHKSDSKLSQPGVAQPCVALPFSGCEGASALYVFLCMNTRQPKCDTRWHCGGIVMAHDGIVMARDGIVMALLETG